MDVRELAVKIDAASYPLNQMSQSDPETAKSIPEHREHEKSNRAWL